MSLETPSHLPELEEHDEFPGGLRKYPDFVPRIPEGATPEDDEYYIVHYEESMAETPPHYRQKAYVIDALKALQPDRWTVGECCLYFDRSQPTQFKAPDVLATLGGPNTEEERTYVMWRDPPVLLVGEIRSKDNTKAQIAEKTLVYAAAGIPEMLAIDPEGCRFELRELHRGQYRPVPPDRDGRCWSSVWDAWFGMDENCFVWVYAPDGSRVGTHFEERERAEREHLRAEEERSRAEQERSRAEQEQLRAEQEQLRAEHERSRAEQERSRAEQAEAQVAALLERLKQLEGS
jgi:Uma2 family endonuclease